MSPRIVPVRSNTEETSGGRLVLREKDALMVPNPRACSQRQLALRREALTETALVSLASGEKISPRIVSVRSNTGETPVVDRYSAKKMP